MVGIHVVEYRVARKTYKCDAGHLIWEFLSEDDLDPEDRELFMKHKEDGCKISPGEKYRYERFLQNGRFHTCRCIPELQDICVKYDLFDHYVD